MSEGEELRMNFCGLIQRPQIRTKKKKIIGNAKEKNIYDIWKGEQINSVRKKLINGDRNYDPCKQCDVNGTLNGNEFRDKWATYLKNNK